MKSTFVNAADSGDRGAIVEHINFAEEPASPSWRPSVFRCGEADETHCSRNDGGHGSLYIITRYYNGSFGRLFRRDTVKLGR